VMRNVGSTLGLLVMGALIVVGMLAAFGAIGNKVPQSPQVEASETTTEQVSQLEREAAALGEPVTAGDLSWTVIDARKETELHKETPPPKPRPGNFVVVNFTVENVSEEPVTLVPGEMVIVDNEGRRFPAEAAINSSYVPFDKNILFNEKSLLEPGTTREGEVNFELPVGASGSVLQLGDANPNADEEKYVDLKL
jgi:Domain of unknown function (DUF4352)